MSETETAERALAAAVVLGRDLDDAMDIAPDMLSDLRRSSIWAAGRALAERGEPRSAPALEAELRKLDRWKVVGLEGLTKASDDYTLAADLRAAARELKRTGKLRALRVAAAELLEETRQPDASADELIERYHGRLLALEKAGIDDALIPAREVVVKTLEDIKRRATGVIHSVTTGLPAVDRMMGGGLESNWMVVLAARPSMGKTAFALQMLLTGASPTLLFSLEMGAIQLGRRIIADRARVPIAFLKNPTKERLFGRVQTAVDWAKSDPKMWVWDQPANVSAIRAVSRRWRRRVPKSKTPPIIVVDYLQLLEAEQVGQNRTREQEVSHISRSLKLMANELDCVVVVLAQLNRDLERREDKRPRLSDLRESGAIEQDADAVLMLFRPWVYDKSQNPTRAEVIARKQREGEMDASCWVDFEPELAQFREREDSRWEH